MVALKAYQTVNQLLYAGTGTRLIDLNEALSQVPIPSNVDSRSRVVLGSVYPTLTVTRVSYRLAIPAMLIGPESEQLRTTDGNDAVLIQTDSNVGMVMKSVIVAGVPEQAQANGEIVGGITFQPGGAIYRCAATHSKPEPAAVRGVAIPDGTQGFAVVLAGSGNITRGGESYSAPNIGAVLDLGTEGAAASIPATITEAWVLYGPSVGV